MQNAYQLLMRKSYFLNIELEKFDKFNCETSFLSSAWLQPGAFVASRHLCFRAPLILVGFRENCFG